MRKLINVLLTISFVLSLGCAGPVLNPDGTVAENQRPAVSAFQVRLLASTTMGAAILAERIPVDQLIVLKTVFSGMNATTLILLKEDIEVLEGEALLAQMRQQYAPLLGPYYPVAEGILALMITSVRPLIDQGQTDAAATYVNATFAGAISAVDNALEFSQPQNPV